MCLYFALMYKTLGGFSWLGLFSETLQGDECGLEPPSNTGPYEDTEDQTLVQSVQHFHLALENLKAVSADIIFLFQYMFLSVVLIIFLIFVGFYNRRI